MTYAEEKRQKDAERAKKSMKYVFDPVLIDCFGDVPLTKGDIVVKIKAPFGCPRNGTMGMCFVGDPETGEFIGMVAENSLKPVKR